MLPWRTRWVWKAAVSVTELLTRVGKAALTSVCLQVKALCAEADRLQQSHPLSATQIQVKREELIANWEQIRTLAAERHARLNDSYR